VTAPRVYEPNPVSWRGGKDQLRLETGAGANAYFLARAPPIIPAEKRAGSA